MYSRQVMSGPYALGSMFATPSVYTFHATGPHSSTHRPISSQVVGTRRIDDRVVEQALTSSELVEQASRRRQLLVVQLPMLLDPGRRAEHRDRGLGLDEDAPQVLAEAVRLVARRALSTRTASRSGTSR